MSVKAILQGQNDKTPKLYLNDDSTLIQDKEDVTDKVKEALNAADKDVLTDVSSTLNAHQVDYSMHVTSEEKNKIANSIGLKEKITQSLIPDKPSSPIAADAEIPWTWEQINAITCAGKATEYFSVGSLKKCTLSSAVLGSTEPMMRVIGIGQDADNTVTFQTKNCLKNVTKFGDNNKWASSTVRDVCQNYYNVCEAKAYIRTISKGTCPNSNSSRNADVTYNDETVFLLSEREFGLDSGASISTSNSTASRAECTQGKNFSYSYFKDNASRIFGSHDNNTATTTLVFERTLNYYYTANICYIDNTGLGNRSTIPTATGKIAPAFVIGNSSVIPTPSPRYTITQGSTDVTNKVQQAIRQVNPNLLVNWYFARPVNQRGKTSYNGDATYSIDRWWTQYETPLSIVDGGIKIGGKWDVQQYFENTLQNATYTLSLLYKDRTGSDPLRLLAGNRTDGDLALIESKDTSGILSITFSTAKLNKVNFGFTGSTDNSAIIIAAKLELGDTQTLAHQDEYGNWVLNEIPDYGEQLRRCQRYCRPILHKLDVCAFGGNYYAYTEEGFEEMRAAPISLTNLNGKNVIGITGENAATIIAIYTLNKYGGVAIQLSQNPNTDIVFLDSQNYLISADL